MPVNLIMVAETCKIKKYILHLVKIVWWSLKVQVAGLVKKIFTKNC